MISVCVFRIHFWIYILFCGGGNVSPSAQSGDGTAAESIGSPQSTQAKASGDNSSKVVNCCTNLGQQMSGFVLGMEQ